eukprot:Phypoly_transcript_00158.p1 GENE.Phypoly_transcript_00158~~Phypoly_transcript_00158.p1  ORF type:complete len:1281 (-),score=198.53 Phypoly_transcript_00158:23-3865(-)
MMELSEQYPLLGKPVSHESMVKKLKSAGEIRNTARALEKVLWIQMIGNFIRALPIFVIEEYYYMFLVLGQFCVIAMGYYGINRMNAWLLLGYILGNLSTGGVDIYLASFFTRADVIDPSISKVGLWVYLIFVVLLVLFNFMSAAVLGTRLFVLVATLNRWSFTNPGSLLYVASIVGVDPKDEQVAVKHATRVVPYGTKDGVISKPSFFPNIFSNKNRLEFCTNSVKTAKYNPITFFPKILWLQFSRLANLYTLAIVLICFFPFSPVSPASSVLPLAFVIATSALKEFLEDLKRHKADHEVNNRETYIFGRAVKTNYYQIGDDARYGFSAATWKDVQVGDIVKVKDNQRLPADLVLLSTSRTDNQCYLETSNLDGETNLKIRYVPTKCAFIKTEKELADIQLRLECEGPNNRVYEFEGVLALQKHESDPKQEKFPIGPDNVVLRGTVLKNTEHIYGLVVYTGKETKVEQNTIPPPQKRSNVEKGVNTKLIWLFLLQTIICVVCSVGHNQWQINKEDQEDMWGPWYLGPNPKYDFIYVSYIILYNTLIPLSMYVSMEMVRVINAQFINNDVEMYDETTDIPSAARNTNILEELGQIQYLLSDKTGTLTNNEMVFSKCTVGGIMYGPAQEDFEQLVEAVKSPSAHGNQAEIAHEFYTSLAICNTVVVDLLASQIGKRVYHAISPDEVALVTAAAKQGFDLVSRIGNTVVVSIFGKEYHYEVLNNVEFNSYRKRMSVIVQMPDGTINLYCKGADSVIFPRLVDSDFNSATQAHVNAFANEGLRTLAICYRTISRAEYEEWQTKFHEAEISLVERQKRMDEVAELIEKDFTLLGAVGIEDKLQEGVPECIEALSEAGVKIWVLTGDKLETAVSVSTACRLLAPNMEKFVLTETSKDALTKKLAFMIAKYNLAATDRTWYQRTLEYLTNCTWPAEEPEPAVGVNGGRVAMVVDGASLSLLLDHDLRYLFLRCAKSSSAVICCRCTPIHKARVVKLVSERSFLWGDGAITLAIGDGANDVPMIQRAHVGVGISGKEGRQAVLASDYAIPQFKSLKRLLFVHGNRSYDRITKLIMYSFCKNTAMCLSQFWFSFYSGFTGQMMYFDYLFTLYNSLFTAIPVLMLAIFEQKYPEETLLRYPSLYKWCMGGENFNNPSLFRWVLLGIYQSILIFMFPYFATNSPLPNGQVVGLWSQGTTSYTVLIIAMNLQLALITKYWTKANILSTMGSVVFYFAFMFVYCATDFATPDAVWIIFKLLGDPAFWFSSLAGPLFAVFPDLVFRTGKAVLVG